MINWVLFQECKVDSKFKDQLMEKITTLKKKKKKSNMIISINEEKIFDKI